MATNLILRTSTSPYGDINKGSVLSQVELDANFIGLKGDIIYTAQTNQNVVTLKKYNGDDLSFDVGSGSGNKWYIPENTTVTITENYQGFIYGDLYVDGTLQLDANSQFVVLNGYIYFGSGGTITGSGDLYNIDLPTFDTFTTGGTYDSGTGTITFVNNSGTTFSVTGITADSGTALTGFTYDNSNNLCLGFSGFTVCAPPISIMSGLTINGGLSAVTITATTIEATSVSATTYYNLPQDVYVTGGTWNPGTYDLQLKRNDDALIGPFNLSILATDMNVTGGTYNPVNGVATFVNNSGGTFPVTGFLTGYTDVYVTGFSNSNNVFSIRDSSGNTISTTLISLTGLTVGALTITGNTSAQSLSATTISATTYLNTPRISGGTYSNGNLSLTTNTGLTISVSGFSFATSGTSIYSTNPSTSNINISNSFVVGDNAGNGATLASGSTFIGYQAGFRAISADSSVFIGYQAGFNGSAHTDSNFIGYQAGYRLTSTGSSANSNFMGYRAGYIASTNGNVNDSNFFGSEAGYNSFGATYSNFFGNQAGYNADNSSNSNFFGSDAGQNASAANNSNFFGNQAGVNADNSNYSNFMGYRAGYASNNSNNSNFMGYRAGNAATGSVQSNFIGSDAGFQSSSSSSSNFIGYRAGFQSNNAGSSNFIGYQTGALATGATQSNFFGVEAGYGATGSTYSNFIGYQAGYNQNLIGNGSNNTFIGYRAGFVYTGETSHGNNNIIIGNGIRLSGASQNGLNIGGVIFGTGMNPPQGSGPSTSGVTSSSNAAIGIRVISPTATLDVSGTTGFNQFRMRTSFTPTGSGDTRGNVGDIAWDNTYIYVKTNTGWGRTQLNYGF